MLKRLRQIVQKVNAAQNLEEALQMMVVEVRLAVMTQAASIFLIDNHHAEYVLIATEGLNPKMVGNIRVGLDESLVGLVGRREEPINLEDAVSHPDFYYHPEVGEEKYAAFLGVPIIHHRRLLGVLTIQQEEKRRYDDSEEAFLVTIAAQLASVIAHADASGELRRLPAFGELEPSEFAEAALTGIPSVPGVGIGQVVVVYPPADLAAVPDKEVEDVDAEIEYFNQALSAAREEIRLLSTRLSDRLPPEEYALFEVYLRILDDESLGREVRDEINNHYWAQAALRRVIRRHVQAYASMEDEYLRERATDLQDLGLRVLAHLQLRDAQTITYPENTILVGEEVSAAALAEVPEGQLAGVVSLRGSSNSHVAILARALRVPTVMGARGTALSELASKDAIVDGYFGQVFVEPEPSLLEEFQTFAKEEDELDQSLEALRDEDGVTPDGYRISLRVNTGLAADAGLSLSVGAEGVGLFRTEVPFMQRDSFPVEDEQRILYRQLLKAFSPRPVTMRTLDIGGDKSLPYFPVEEVNPFLGWRGIRLTLDHPEFFLVQVRAMLKANHGLDNLRIMLPMVTSLGEVDEALNLIRQAHAELCEEEMVVAMPQVGVMIEVPAAVYQARDIAKKVDFLSVGSNDLTQYMLAVDRNNARVAPLYDSLHPAVLRALIQTVEGGHSEGKRVGICGEMASDPVAVVLLLAMGFDILSMNASSLLRMKWVVRNFSMAYARKLLGEVLEMNNPTLIRFHVEKAIDEMGLGGLIRAGKR
jgi:phosphotransferase system, enzyme I, PtsP